MRLAQYYHIPLQDLLVDVQILAQSEWKEASKIQYRITKSPINDIDKQAVSLFERALDGDKDIKIEKSSGLLLQYAVDSGLIEINVEQANRDTDSNLRDYNLEHRLKEAYPHLIDKRVYDLANVKNINLK